GCLRQGGEWGDGVRRAGFSRKVLMRTSKLKAQSSREVPCSGFRGHCVCSRRGKEAALALSPPTPPPHVVGDRSSERTGITWGLLLGIGSFFLVLMFEFGVFAAPAAP